MRILFSVLVMLGFALPAWSQELHQYEFSLLNVVYPKADYDHFTKAALEVLRERGRLESCIDLKRDLILPKNYEVKNAAGKSTKVATLVRFLLREPLEQSDLDELIPALCEGEGPKCEVVGWKMSPSIKDLKMSFTYQTNSVLDVERKLKTINQDLPLPEVFPRFSSSCESGSSGDAVLFTGRSIGAQALIKRSPVKLDKLIRVGLVTKDGKPFWNFGRPDIWWTGHPTTEEDQELAPKDILDDLN